MRTFSIHARRLALTALLLASVLAAPTWAKDATPHIQVSLIAANQELAAGQDNWVAVRLAPQSGWHTYWRNPGDTGLPTKIDWTLPKGVTAGPIQWPYPSVETLSGLINYGYTKPTLHLVQIHVPADWPTGNKVDLEAKVSWLVCKDICVPGSTELSLALPVTDGQSQADPAHAREFAQARADLPQPLPSDAQAKFQIADKRLRLAVQPMSVPAGAKLVFFPYTRGLIDGLAKPAVDLSHDAVRFAQSLSKNFAAAPDKVHGVLTVTAHGATTAYAIDAAPGTVGAVKGGGAKPATESSAAAQQPSSEVDRILGTAIGPAGGGGVTSILPALLFALLGGLILNLMPCVFPVLAMKALALVESQTEGVRSQRLHALAYTFGVLLSTALAAGLLFLLRGAGNVLGWGFQLQSPPFVAVLVYLLFVMGLWMSGVFTLGGTMMGVGQNLTQRRGLTGSFFTGVLAVLVASPCTAPFMATAIGYALTAPALVALAVFLALGLGLALPFALIAAFPILARWLPKPGAWMETFKEILAFPLYLTAIWLLWVLTRQVGGDGMALALVGVLVLAIGFWALGRWPQKRISTVVAIIAILIAGALLTRPELHSGARQSSAAGHSTQAKATLDAMQQPFSEKRLAELRKQGKTVFVDFTADWCLTCKANERVALKDPRVVAAFKRDHVVYMVGDWTDGNPKITQVLNHFGRPGVPLYLLYADGRQPRILPQILTPQIVLDALQKATQGGSAAAGSSS